MQQIMQCCNSGINIKKAPLNRTFRELFIITWPTQFSSSPLQIHILVCARVECCWVLNTCAYAGSRFNDSAFNTHISESQLLRYGIDNRKWTWMGIPYYSFDLRWMLCAPERPRKRRQWPARQPLSGAGPPQFNRSLDLVLPVVTACS